MSFQYKTRKGLENETFSNLNPQEEFTSSEENSEFRSFC